MLVQRVAPKHTAHGVGEQGDDLVPLGADIVAALHGFRNIVLGVKDAVDGDILVRHIGGQLVLQAVDVNEDTVEFFFVGFKLQKALLTFGFPSSVGIGQTGNRADERVSLEIP